MPITEAMIAEYPKKRVKAAAAWECNLDLDYGVIRKAFVQKWSRPLLIMSNTSSTNVGVCIYCGTDQNLTDEHAIPFALKGSRTLKDASCLACNAITTRFERSILRKNMLAVRTVLGLPTRRKKNRPTELPLIFVRGNSRSEEMVPIEDVIPAFVFPELGPPIARKEMGHALGLQPGEFQPKAHLIADRATDAHVSNVLAKYSADAVETPWEIDHNDFLRLIAKIAMCEAITCYGYEQFERFLFVKRSSARTGLSIGWEAMVNTPYFNKVALKIQHM
jgi:hypothetical protein